MGFDILEMSNKKFKKQDIRPNVITAMQKEFSGMPRSTRDAEKQKLLLEKIVLEEKIRFAEEVLRFINSENFADSDLALQALAKSFENINVKLSQPELLEMAKVIKARTLGEYKNWLTNLEEITIKQRGNLGLDLITVEVKLKKIEKENAKEEKEIKIEARKIARESKIS